MTKSDDYLWDRSGEPDPEVARLESLLSPLAHDAPLDELRLYRSKRRGWLIASSAMVAAAAAVLLIVLWPGRGGPQTPACAGSGFAFSADSGTVSCNGVALARGALPVGGTLETGTQQAKLAIADIGEAQLGKETVVRLDRAQYGADPKHQLHLERGHMHAKVNAKPKIFAVTTPSADVTDLGCEYTIDLDRSGAGRIVVHTGRVELETGTHKPIELLAGMHARLLPGRRAGIPLSDKAGPAMEQAAADYDAGKPDALAGVLAAATRDDAITLQRLALVLPRAQLRPLYEKLQTLFPIPQDTTLDEALADDALLEMWLDEVDLSFRVAPR